MYRGNAPLIAYFASDAERAPDSVPAAESWIAPATSISSTSVLLACCRWLQSRECSWLVSVILHIL